MQMMQNSTISVQWSARDFLLTVLCSIKVFRLELSIPFGKYLAIPATGLLPNDSSLTVNVPDMNLQSSILHSPAIGAISEVSVVVDSDSMGRVWGVAVGLELAFRVLMLVQRGESVRFDFPGMIRLSTSSDLFLVDGALFAATFDGRTPSIILTAKADIKPGTRCNALIAANQGIQAVNLTRGKSTISSDALNGPVLPTVIERIPCISASGSFFSTSISFGPNAYAGAVTDMTISFQSTVSLASGDYVMLKLSGFSVHQTSRSSSALAIDSKACSTYSDTGDLCLTNIINLATDGISNQGDGVKMTFNVQSGIACSSKIQLYISQAARIALPWDGTYGKSVMIWGIAYAGSVDMTPVQIATSIGSVGSSPSLNMDPLKAATAAKVELSFIAYMPICSGDAVLLRLPGFKLAAMEVGSDKIISNPPIVANASWSDPILYLNLVFSGSCVSPRSVMDLMR